MSLLSNSEVEEVTSQNDDVLTRLRSLNYMTRLNLSEGEHSMPSVKFESNFSNSKFNGSSYSDSGSELSSRHYSE